MTLFEFADAMNTELDENSYKDGWNLLSDDWLLNRLRQETGELERELKKPHKDAKKILSEAADVANFAYMIADNARRETG